MQSGLHSPAGENLTDQTGVKQMITIERTENTAQLEPKHPMSEVELEAVVGGMTNAETPWGQAFIKGFYKGLCGPPNGCGPWGYLG
jgi:hypothetical protein